MSGSRVWILAGRCLSLLRECKEGPSILLYPGSNQMVCRAGPLVARRASSAWGRIGTRWQMGSSELFSYVLLHSEALGAKGEVQVSTA